MKAMSRSELFRRMLDAPVGRVARRTPLEPAERLSARLSRDVLLKREDLQPVFSFKLRGAYACMCRLDSARRARGVIAASAGNHAQGVALAAARLGIEARIVKQLEVGCEGRVHICQPEQQQLFLLDLGMRHTSRFTLHIFVQGNFPAINPQGRELVGKGVEYLINMFLAETTIEPLQRLLQHLGILLLPVERNHIVQDLINQAHRIDMAGLDRLLRMVENIALLVHLLRKDAGGTKVGKNNIAAKCEERLVKLIAVARLPGDMKLHPNGVVPLFFH